MPKHPLHIQLTRPLAVFDIEATGTHPQLDRIIDLAVCRIEPDGSRREQSWRVHPGMPIPPDSTRIHGIRDADVAFSPRFEEIARDILEFLKDCDLGGFNLIRFDIPMLAEECRRAGVSLALENRRIVDAQRIFHAKEPRDLTAALRFYCGEMHLGAHGAMDDVIATFQVLEAQLQRYPDLPRDMDGLDRFCNPPDPYRVDLNGRLRWVNGEIALNFGKKKGMLLKEVLRKEPSFIQWMLKSDFPGDVKQILEDACAGKWPTPPPEAAG